MDFDGDESINSFWEHEDLLLAYGSHIYGTALLDSMSLEEITNPILWDKFSSDSYMIEILMRQLDFNIGIYSASEYFDIPGNTLCCSSIQHRIRNIVDDPKSTIDSVNKLIVTTNKSKKYLRKISLAEIHAYYQVSAHQFIINKIGETIQRVEIENTPVVKPRVKRTRTAYA